MERLELVIGRERHRLYAETKSRLRSISVTKFCCMLQVHANLCETPDRITEGNIFIYLVSFVYSVIVLPSLTKP